METADRLLVEPTPKQVFAGAGAARRPQLRFKQRSSGGEGFEQGLLPLRPLALLRRRLRHLQPGLAGQALDRLDKIEIVGAHEIADRIAMRAAAEAMKEPLVLDDVEGRGLLVVERAEAGVLAALAGQPKEIGRASCRER